MPADKRWRAALLGLILGALPATVPANGISSEPISFDSPRPGAPLADVSVPYSLAILAGAAWRPEQVQQAARQAEGIFDQCGVSVRPTAMYRLHAPDAYRTLDEAMQARLLAALPAARPVVVFVAETSDADTAYAYRSSVPSASRGSAWLTQRAAPACLGVLLAHELGHILLDSAEHSADPAKLMYQRCRVSNIAGSRPGSALSPAQCRRLRAR